MSGSFVVFICVFGLLGMSLVALSAVLSELR